MRSVDDGSTSEPAAAAAACPPPPLPGPLSPEDLRALAEANARTKKIRAACRVAAFNGWTFAIFAVGSAMFGLAARLMGEWDWLSWIVAAALAVIASNEFAGRRMLQRLDDRGATLLGWNQIALLVLVVGYCVWQLHDASRQADEYTRQFRAYPEVTRMLGGMNIGHMMQSFSWLLYGSVIAVSVVYQGVGAWYYFRRGGLIREYLASTPAWVVDVQRIGAR